MWQTVELAYCCLNKTSLKQDDICKLGRLNDLCNWQFFRIYRLKLWTALTEEKVTKVNTNTEAMELFKSRGVPLARSTKSWADLSEGNILLHFWNSQAFCRTGKWWWTSTYWRTPCRSPQAEKRIAFAKASISQMRPSSKALEKEKFWSVEVVKLETGRRQEWNFSSWQFGVKNCGPLW